VRIRRLLARMTRASIAVSGVALALASCTGPTETALSNAAPTMQAEVGTEPTDLFDVGATDAGSSAQTGSVTAPLADTGEADWERARAEAREQFERIRVFGPPGQEPNVEFEAPLTMGYNKRVMFNGTGAILEEGDLITVHAVFFAPDGTKLSSSWENNAPLTIRLEYSSLDDLIGARVGARLLFEHDGFDMSPEFLAVYEVVDATKPTPSVENEMCTDWRWQEGRLAIRIPGDECRYVDYMWSIALNPDGIYPGNYEPQIGDYYWGSGSCADLQGDGPINYCNRDAIGELENIVVADGPGLQPSISMPIPLVLTEPAGRLVTAGTGEPLQAGQILTLKARYYNELGGQYGFTEEGMVEAADWSETFIVLGSESSDANRLNSVLTGARVGARVLTGSTQWSRGEIVTFLNLYEVAGAQPAPAHLVGEMAKLPPDRPVVSQTPGDSPMITVPSNYASPQETELTTLIRGTGEEVQPGQDLVVDYVATLSQDGETFADGSRTISSWAAPGFPVLANSWPFINDLAGQTVGSRVLLEFPPGSSPQTIPGRDFTYDGSGGSLWVVDILAAVN